MPTASGWRVDATTHAVHVADVASQAEAEATAEHYIAGHGGEGFVMVCDANGAVLVAKRFAASPGE
jgi:hypothetical protein